MAKKQKLKPRIVPEESNALTDLIESDDTTFATPITMEKLRAKAKELRDARQRVDDLEETLKQAKALATQLETKELPDLFSQAKTKAIEVEAEGNNPAFSARKSPYYKAVLPEESGPGLTWLEDNGHGDIVKAVYTVKLPRGTEEMSKALKDFLEEGLYEYELKETVPWTTLTAFVKEQIEKGEKLPLEPLGAFVGEIVKIKPAKEK
jgi:hypothetical protein